MEEFLRTLIATLNTVEVKGKDNMDKLLGCIFMAEHQLAKIRTEESTEVVSEGE